MQNLLFVRNIPKKLFAPFLLAVTLAALAGCGSGAGSTDTGTGSTGTGSTGTGTTTTSTQTLTGTAASGNPIAGATITIKDSSTIAKTASGTTAADGTFSVAVTGMTPPFMLVATKTGQQNLYSILPAMDMTTNNTQHVNVTPITTLVMYELSNKDPATMYATGSFSTVTAGAVSAKEVAVRSNLPANSVNPVFSMMYGQFTATGAQDSTGYDSALDGLGSVTSITSTGVSFSGGLTYTTGSGTGVAGTPSITLTLRNVADTATVTSVDSSTPALVKATVRDANGVAVSGAIVTFTTDAAFGSFLGGANTALTDAGGTARVTLTTANTSGGASSVTANTTLPNTTTTATGSINYSVGASTITLSPITLGVGTGTLSAYGTTSVSVTLLNNGSPYTSPMPVSFTSTCAGSGKATLTTSVTTVNGVATASYLDNGCNNPTAGDTITASLANGTSVTTSLKVNAPALGSIQFVSVVTNPATNPPVITLKGTGGLNRSETAQITFRVVDSAGNPVGNQTVNFSLNTSIGGLALGATSAVSDPTTGNVVTNVISGTVSTAVRVTATVGNLSTQSDQLVISTGIPAQDGFSLSASQHNVEGANTDGTPTTLTVRLVDHFRNPVPDGTAVSFTSEGGAVVPSCVTVGGTCSVVLTSQAPRPTNDRVTVLARATGEEAFTDLNGNGTVDNVGEMIDVNGASTDMPEAFVDYNENGIRDANEPFFDFDGSGTYSPADGKYNGVLCTSGAAICSTQKSMDVRASQVIVFSTSQADVTINNNAMINLPSCTAGGPGVPLSFTVTVVDKNGNAMPVGTVVAFSADNGTITSATSYTVPDTSDCRSSYAGCPASAGVSTLGDINVIMKSDDTWSNGVCTAVNGHSGTFTVRVTTPKGLITTTTIGVTD